LSACLSQTAPQSRLACRQFGLAFGTAYQVYDDCVDLFGSETVAGKSLGTDLAKGKLTLPVLLLWERAKAGDRARLRKWVRAWQSDSLKPMAELLAKHDTLGASLDIIHQYLAKARRCLEVLPSSGGRAGLIDLTEYLARQTDALGKA
jgi:octaprenyl-diphosphate synthase